MTIKVYMEQHPDVTCVRMNTLIVGLRTDGEPFYFAEGNGPYCFGLTHDTIQKMMLEEMLPQYMTEERHAVSSII